METLFSISTKTRINPSKPETAEFFEEYLVGYILRPIPSWAHSQKNDICVTSHGRLHKTELGSKFTKGSCCYEVVGIVELGSGNSEGFVPTKAIAHHVFK